MTKKTPSSSLADNPTSFHNSPILVSACLLGLHCRYDGRAKGSPGLTAHAASHRFIPFCPEQLGGLPTPRPAATILGGDGCDVIGGKARVVTKDGQDVTRAFIRGAEESLHLARLFGVKAVFLKDKSPSCGLQTPYCESPSGRGMGVAASLLRGFGLQLFEFDPGTPIPASVLSEWLFDAT